MALTQVAGTANAGILKTSSGRVFAARATNANAAVRYLCLVDKATTPINTDPAVAWMLLPAGTAAAPSVSEIGAQLLDQDGVVCSLGVSWAVSTTAATVTLATAADHNVSIRWQ